MSTRKNKKTRVVLNICLLLIIFISTLFIPLQTLADTETPPSEASDKEVSTTPNPAGTVTPGKQKVTGKIISGEDSTPMQSLTAIATPDGTCYDTQTSNDIASTQSNSRGEFTINLKPNKEYILCVNKLLDEWYDPIIKAIPIYSTFNDYLGKEASLRGQSTVTIDNTGQIISGTTTVYVEVVVENLFTKAIVEAVGALMTIIKSAISYVSSGVNSVLILGNTVTDNKDLGQVWTTTRNLALMLLTLGLLIIAFANVLQIDLERYGVNRLIPKIIIAIIMTYFSYLIIRFLFEMVNAFQFQLSGTSAGTKDSLKNISQHYTISTIHSSVMKINPGEVFATLGDSFLTLLMAAVLFFAFIWLCLVLLVRIAVLWILVAVAPFAFMMMIMPFTESLYKAWWQKFWTWLFMGPAVLFLLWLSGAIIDSVSSVAPWIQLLLAATCIFLAATLPLSMGKDVYGAISGAWGKMKGGGKLVDKLTGKRISTAYGLRKGARESAIKLKSQKAQALRAQKSPIGRFVAGMNEDQAAAARVAVVGDIEKNLEANKTFDELQNIGEAGGLEGEAAQNILAANGKIDTSRARLVSLVTARATKDRSFGAKIADKQKDFYAGAANAVINAGTAGTPVGAEIINQANKHLEGNVGDFGKDSFEYMAQHRRDVLASTIRDEGALKKLEDTGKAKIMAALGRAEEIATTAGDADVIAAAHSHVPGSDGNKILNSAGRRNNDWTNNHGGPGNEIF